jgi:hypothetical protein
MQGTTMRRPSMFGGFTAMLGIFGLLFGLAAVDERVRLQLVRVFSGNPPTGEIVTVKNEFQQLLAVTWQAVVDQSVENAPLFIFSVAALVLVVWMTRT